jgi:hypothetical protein
MNIEHKLVVTLDKDEAKTLKKLLGNLTGDEYKKAGIKTEEERGYMHELWNLIPYYDDEDE